MKTRTKKPIEVDPGIAALKVGDEVARISDGRAFRDKVGHRTAKRIRCRLYTYSLAGYSVDAGVRSRIRVPTEADRAEFARQDQEASRMAEINMREKALKSDPAFVAADRIGYLLADSPAACNPKTYHAMANRIGLSRLQEFLEIVEAAQQESP